MRVDANGKGSGLRGLIAINAGLLLLLAGVTFGGSALAQRARGTYTMVAGSVNGAPSQAIYIADVTNQRLLAVTFDPSTNGLVGIDGTDMARDARQGARGANR